MAGLTASSLALINRLEGSRAAKERLTWVLQVHSGAYSVGEACAALGMSPQEFDELHDTAIAAMVTALENAT
jgi:hypothetical protein